jgi:hypothetical protein
MRIWTLHPKFLDAKRLNSQWREALGIHKVLATLHENNDSKPGYRNHPQLQKIYYHFKDYEKSGNFVTNYLWTIFYEGNKRGYKYNKELLKSRITDMEQIKVNFEQLKYELALMIEKNCEYSYECGNSRKTLKILKFEDVEVKSLYNPCFKITNETNLLEWWEKPKQNVLKLLNNP